MMTLADALTCADNMRTTIDAEGFACAEDFALVCLAAEVRRLQAVLTAVKMDCKQWERHYKELREENERLRKNTFLWRDIATAPKDGTEVFLMRRDAVGVAAIGAGLWGRRADGSCDEWIAFNRHQRFPQTPTHWMPLPPEPTP